MRHYDIAIIGSGPAGATMAHRLSQTGARILLVERGGYLPREPANWEVDAVFLDRRYRADEYWTDRHGRRFAPGIHYFVGGNSKVYAAVMLRYRREDFSAIEYLEGISPAWPFGYDELAPYYDRAESLFGVHGRAGDDPTEPAPRGPYPHGAVPHEPVIDALCAKLASCGLHPFNLPLAIDLHPGGTCVRCATCDAFPCRVGAKGDAEMRCVRGALESGRVDLITESFVRRLIVSPDGRRIESVEIEQHGETRQIAADTVIVSCGAINSAALLLRSACASHPNGLANGSDQVGRNYMVHNNTALMALAPGVRNRTKLQKTLGVNDFYVSDHDRPPLGSVQTLGKIQGAMLKPVLPWVPRSALDWLSTRSVDWWLMSEDLPQSGNRVQVDGARSIRIDWQPNNLNVHACLVREWKRILREMGYPVLLSRRLGIEATSHQCGTVRIGTDPATAPLDPSGKAFDIDNLYVVDGSNLPSSAAVNPTLTIVALALRAADAIACAA